MIPAFAGGAIPGRYWRPWLPVQGHVRARLFRCVVLVDMINSGYRNEVMMISIRRIPCLVSLILSIFQMVDLPTVFPSDESDVRHAP